MPAEDTSPATWLVQRTLRTEDGVPSWETVAGYGTKDSARAHVTQCRRHAFTQGYALRVVPDQEESTP